MAKVVFRFTLARFVAILSIISFWAVVFTPVPCVACLTLTLSIHAVTGCSIVAITLVSAVWSKLSYWAGLGAIFSHPTTRASTLPCHMMTISSLAPTLLRTPLPIQARHTGLHAIEPFQTKRTFTLPGHWVTFISRCVTSGADLYTVNTVMSFRAGDLTFLSSKSPGASTLAILGITRPIFTITFLFTTFSPATVFTNRITFKASPSLVTVAFPCHSIAPLRVFNVAFAWIGAVNPESTSLARNLTANSFNSCRANTLSCYVVA
jgi:hypothetical protein